MMKEIKAEGQWDGQDRVTLNIPDFPHLHLSLTTETTTRLRYPHPLEYFLLSLVGTIIITIKNHIENKNILIKNLYITLDAELENNRQRFTEIVVEIRMDSNSMPDELTDLQKTLSREDPIFQLICHNEVIKINWD